MNTYFPLVAAILLIVLLSLSPATVAAQTADVPDLRITANNLTISPTTIKDGVTATFKAKVENIGTAKAGNVTTRFFVSDTQIGEKVTTSINKNQSATVSVTYAIPASMVGNQTLRVVVDPNNTIAEGNETNNEATKDFTVLPNLPDLSITSGDISITPASFKSGDQVTFKATIRNTGVASASNVLARFFLAETQIGEKNAGTISANSNKSAQLVYQLPGNLTGEQILKVTVDPDNAITETSEANNQAEKTINIGGSFIDLAINEGNITFSNTSPKPGQSITVAATVSNSGNSEAKGVTVQIFVDNNKISEKKNLNINANKTSKVSTNYKIPSGAVTSFSFAVKVDPEGKISETDETNNTATKTLVVNPLNIDLAINQKTVSVTPADQAIIAGRKFTVSGQISNIGLDRADSTKVVFNLVEYQKVKPGEEENLGDMMQRLKENGLTIGDLLIEQDKQEKAFNDSITPGVQRVLVNLGSANVSTLNAGKATSFSKQLTLPGDYQLNTAEIEINVDPDNKNFEVNKGNNVYILELETQPQTYDASITSNAITHTPANTIIMAGHTVTLHGRIDNLGTETIKNLKIRYLINTKPLIEGATVLDNKTIATISAGQSATINPIFTIPATAQDNQVIIIWLDPDNSLNESSEANNVAYHTIPVNPQTRDLSVVSLRSNPVQPKVGDPVTWNVKIKNYGNTKAENVSLALYTDLSSQPAFTDTILSLAAGANTTKIFHWTVPSDLAYAINYPVRAVVDWDNQINESNEENNSQTYLLSLTAPDLSVGSADMTFYSSAIYQGKNFWLDVTVHNTNVMAVPSTKVGLFYYVSGNNNALTKLTELDSGVFAKGENKSLRFVSKLPDTIALGTNVGLVIVADSSNSVLETDETNNRAEITRTVAEPPRQVVYPYMTVVVNDDNGNPLDGATVTLRNNDTQVPQTKTTGTENYYYSVGRVIFEALPDTANYTVTMSHAGYRTLTDTFTFDKYAYDSDYREYSLDKKAILSGTVTAGGVGLGWVTVSILDTQINTVTDSQGNYQILLNGGNYGVKFTLDGYSRVIANSVAVAPLSNTILNEAMSTGTVGYFEGLITNDGGEGLAGVEIKANGNTIAYTDSGGEFSFNSTPGAKTFNFSKSGYVGVQFSEAVTAGHEYYASFIMYPPSTANHVERGAMIVSWHQHEATPEHAIVDYSVDVWWGLGRINMSMDYDSSSSNTKITNLTVGVEGLQWECHRVEGAGDIETSAIDIPITIAAGGCDSPLTRMDVCRIAIVSDGVEIWSDNNNWNSGQGTGNAKSQTYNFSNDNLLIDWNSDFQIKMWLMVQQKSGVTNEGEGSGALAGYYLDKKLITWYPQKPPTTTISTSWEQVGSYLWGIVENPLNAVMNFTDLFTVEEYNQYTMEEVLPADYPCASP
jgi:subtilase family serine protease